MESIKASQRIEPTCSYEHDPQTYAIIGAAMEVHSYFGRGFLERVYQDALEIEFTKRGIPAKREVDLPVYYKGDLLRSHYHADFICYDDVLVEIKALSRLTPVEVSQILNYLKVTGTERGLLINFGSSSLQQHRYVYSDQT